jgi:hypothetical protein
MLLVYYCIEEGQEGVFPPWGALSLCMTAAGGTSNLDETPGEM